LLPKTSEDAQNVLPSCLASLSEKSPDLATVIAAWPSLSEPVKAGILAMVNASARREGAKP